MYIHTKCGKQVHLQDEIVHLWRKKNKNSQFGAAELVKW